MRHRILPHPRQEFETVSEQQILTWRMAKYIPCWKRRSIRDIYQKDWRHKSTDRILWRQNFATQEVRSYRFSVLKDRHSKVLLSSRTAIRDTKRKFPGLQRLSGRHWKVEGRRCESNTKQRYSYSLGDPREICCHPEFWGSSRQWSIRGGIGLHRWYHIPLIKSENGERTE